MICTRIYNTSVYEYKYNWLYRTDICHISIGIPLANSAKDVSSRKQKIIKKYNNYYYKKHKYIYIYAYVNVCQVYACICKQNEFIFITHSKNK